MPISCIFMVSGSEQLDLTDYTVGYMESYQQERRSMIESPWAYTALLLLCAGLFPYLERHRQWRVFAVLPPIVMTYLLVTGLSVAGIWQIND